MSKISETYSFYFRLKILTKFVFKKVFQENVCRFFCKNGSKPKTKCLLKILITNSLNFCSHKVTKLLWRNSNYSWICYAESGNRILSPFVTIRVRARIESWPGLFCRLFLVFANDLLSTCSYLENLKSAVLSENTGRLTTKSLRDFDNMEKGNTVFQRNSQKYPRLRIFNIHAPINILIYYIYASNWSMFPN